MQGPGLSGLSDVRPIGLGDWVTVAAIAVSLVLVMEVFKRLPARRMSPR